MQAPKRTRVRHPISCTECRRRKQKCIPGTDRSCQNCSRRYPPVECIGLRESKGKWETYSLADRTLILNEAGRQPSARGITPAGEHPPVLSSNTRPILPAPRPFGGTLTELSTLNGLPIQPTQRNAELFHFFNQFVMPNYVSVDGQNLPPLFMKSIRPWMIQSPLMPNIAILMASYSERLERGVEVRPYSETFSMKAHVLGLVNKFLEQDFRLISDEAIRAVVHIVILEWWWGSEKSLWAHMRGIKEMVRLEGGLANLPDPTLTDVLTLTDYELACCYELPLFFDYPQERPSSPIPPPAIMPTFSPFLSAPLFPAPSTFLQNSQLLDISTHAAEILDDVRFLALSITSITSTTKTLKIQSTASWLNNRISSVPDIVLPESGKKGEQRQLISITIRLAALVYSSSIATLTPFATPTPTSLKHLVQIKEVIPKVGMTRWKEIPGIFLWILLVLCPSCGDGIQDRSLRKKMAVTGMAIGLEGFGLGIEYLKAHWSVQRWIASEKERAAEVKLKPVEEEVAAVPLASVI